MRGSAQSLAMKSSAVRQLSTSMDGAEHLPHAVSRMVDDACITHGAGSWLHFSDGRRMLDFSCGIAVTNTGHCHPRVVKAIQEQATRVLHAQMNVAASAPVLALINRLHDVVPMDSPSFLFCNSGAEAVENSVKLARLHTGKQNVVVLQHSFHGRTMGALAMTTSKAAYRQGTGPHMPGVFVVPAPYCCHCTSKRDSQGSCCSRPLEELRLLLKSQSPAADTAAIVVEPVLGEGGYVVPPPEYLRELRKICDENGILLVADEVQSGFGRTGKFFAVEHFLRRDEAPDIMLLAKGIASGMPLSAVACNPEVMASAPKATVGGTYGGNPVSCAAAVATIDVMQEENLLENAEKRGQQLRGRLEKMKEKRPTVIQEIRGLGLMNAVEFSGSGGIAAKVSALAVKENLLLMPTGAFDTMRFMPPLTVNEEEVDQAMDIFEKCLDTAAPQ